jgi:hypothetical protein
MTNYEDMTVEELKELKEKREKDTLMKTLTEEDEATKKGELELHDTEVAENAIQTYVDNLNITTPDVVDPVLEPPVDTLIYSDDTWDKSDDAAAEVEDIKKMYTEMGINWKTEYGGELEEHPADFTYTAGSDNGCDESAQLGANWTVSEHFCNFIWHAKECYMGLGKICASVCDLKAGNGDDVVIKVISARADPNAVSACTCLSCASNTFDKYTITITQRGDYAVLCGWDEFTVGSSYRRSVLKSMAQHWGVYFDAQIFAALAAGTGTYTETLNNTLDCNGVITGSCCTNGSDIYGRLLDLDARMRVAGYNPDYFICSPTVANYFKYLQTPGSALAMPSIKMEGTTLTKIGNIKVLEYCGATACSSTTATEVGWLIDSSRAIGQVFGKKPSFEFDRVIECNAEKIVMWAYWGVAVLDPGAVGQIVTPNS